MPHFDAVCRCATFFADVQRAMAVGKFGLIRRVCAAFESVGAARRVLQHISGIFVKNRGRGPTESKYPEPRGIDPRFLGSLPAPDSLWTEVLSSALPPREVVLHFRHGNRGGDAAQDVDQTFMLRIELAKLVCHARMYFIGMVHHILHLLG